MNTDVIPKPVQDWLGTITGWQLFLGIFVACVIIIGVVRLVRRVAPGIVAFARGIIKWAEISKALDGLPAFMEKTEKTLMEQNLAMTVQNQVLQDHTKQLKNSHSTNLRDDVTDVINGVEAINEKLIVVTETLQILDERGLDNRARIDELEDTLNPRKEIEP